MLHSLTEIILIDLAGTQKHKAIAWEQAFDDDKLNNTAWRVALISQDTFLLKRKCIRLDLWLIIRVGKLNEDLGGFIRNNDKQQLSRSHRSHY